MPFSRALPLLILFSVDEPTTRPTSDPVVQPQVERPGYASAEQQLSGEILFYSEASGAKQLYLLELDSNLMQPIGKSGSRPDHYPRWSPDGKKVVFQSYRRGGWHPWIMDADGSHARRITSAPSGSPRHYEFDPSFASDNKTIVFVSNSDLYQVSVDEPTPVRIGASTPSLLEASPTYAPDMQRIAFDGYHRGTNSLHVYTVSPDGGDRQQLTSGQAHHLSPTWSPNGEKLLFYSDREGSFELYEMNADGSGIRRLLQPDAWKEAGFTEARLVDPWDNDNGAVHQYRASYSPDGNWIAFSRDVDGDRELFVTNIEGTNIVRLTFQKGHDGFPEWRPTPFE